MSRHLRPLNTRVERDHTRLSPGAAYDEGGDASSLHSSRSEQDTDSDDDELIARARNSTELRARDRMVLTEEEETDRLVTDTRARLERQRSWSRTRRRASNLPLPNPIRLLRSYSQTRSRSPADNNINNNNSSSINNHNHSSSAIEDDDEGDEKQQHEEKRRSRRARRREKRERLLEEAEHGEDGALMQEMERGGMKEGSTTGDSSDRDDSDELDRRRLLEVAAEAKAGSARKWKRWLFVYSLIAVGFAFLVLLAWKLSVSNSSIKGLALPALVSNGTALFAPTTLIISLDGFRADFLQRGLTPRLNAFVKEGVSPLYMMPSFPSVTFPVSNSLLIVLVQLLSCLIN